MKQSPTFNFEWIDKRRIFKKISPCKTHVKISKKSIYENKYKDLDSKDDMLNNNNIVHNIVIDMKLQETNQKNKELIDKNRVLKKITNELKLNESKVLESYEIEQMTVKSLEEYLKALEDDYTKMMHEGDVVIQELKKEKHMLNMKAYNANKEIELDKI